jgi:hypothetical protein
MDEGEHYPAAIAGVGGVPGRAVQSCPLELTCRSFVLEASSDPTQRRLKLKILMMVANLNSIRSLLIRALELNTI